MDKILTLPIKTISKLYLEGCLKPTNVTETALIKTSQYKRFNGFITVCDETAKNQSKTSNLRYLNGKPLSEIDGVPIAVKDNFCTKDILTTCASKVLENFRPTYDATVVERLLKAGAVLIGKTNLDEFAMGSGTTDSIFGVTKNVWKSKNDDFCIAGGSSGGSAVAVATGICYGAIGSDTGGSTRNPASYCGIVGFKPTYGLVSRYGLIPLVNSMDVPGILTRNIDDTVTMLNTIAGFDSKDSTSLTKPYRKIRLPPANKMTIKGLKIGIPREYHHENLSEDVLNVWKEIASALEQDGAVIKQVSMPHTKHSIVCYSILNQCDVASNMARFDGIEYGFRADEHYSTEKLYALTRRIGFNNVVKNRILAGNYFLLSRNYDKYFDKALKVRRLIAYDFDEVFRQVQIILTPTTLTEAPLFKDFVKKTNRDQCALQDYCTQPANMAGVPALSIPIRLSRNGLPLSLQLMGRKLSEPQLLALGKYIEGFVKFDRKFDFD